MAGVIDSLMVTLGLDPSKFKAGVENVQKDLHKLDNAVKQTGGQVTELGNKWGGTLSGIVKSFAGPLLAGASLGAMVKSYTSDIAKVAKQRGVYNERLEEERKKRALLQRVTKEDLDLYKKSREAMAKFDIATSNLSATFMRAFMPAMKFAVGILNKIADWIDRNQNNITRFLLVVASIVSTALIPAFARWAKVMLANPITWLVAALMGLALIIDDLIVYMQGGKSAFADFWKQFGTGEEIANRFKAVWNQLLEAFNKYKVYLPTILRGIGLMAGFKTVATAIGLVRTAISGLGKAFIANLPFMAIAAVVFAISDLITYLQGGESALSEFWSIFGSGKEITEAIASGWETLKAIGTSMFNDLIALIAVFQSAFGGMFEPIKGIFKDFFAFLKALFTGNFEEAGAKLRSVFKNAIDAIKAMFMGLFNIVEKIWNMLPSFDSIKDFGGKAVDGVGSFVKGLLGGDKEDEKKPQLPMVANRDQMTQAAIPATAQVTTNNDTTVTNTANVGAITINTAATDASGLARDVGPAIQKSAPGWAGNAQNGTMYGY